MNKKQSQSGSIHLIIVIVLVVTLIGALGFIFWQNFMQPKTSDTNSSTTASTATVSDITYKKYTTTGKYSVSFNYPSAWTIVNTNNSDAPYYGRVEEIKNTEGKKVAEFGVVSAWGVGGTCDGDSLTSYNVMESSLTKFIGVKDVYFSSMIITNSDGTYSVKYGLNDMYKELGPESACVIAMSYAAAGPLADMGVVFADSLGAHMEIKFNNYSDAVNSLNSDEYKEIKKMILSISY